jgi:hypothetical protein
MRCVHMGMVALAIAFISPAVLADPTPKPSAESNKLAELDNTVKAAEALTQGSCGDQVRACGRSLKTGRRAACGKLRKCVGKCRSTKKTIKTKARRTKGECRRKCKRYKGKKKRSCQKKCRRSYKTVKKTTRRSKKSCRRSCRSRLLTPACKKARREFVFNIIGCGAKLITSDDCRQKLEELGESVKVVTAKDKPEPEAKTPKAGSDKDGKTPDGEQAGIDETESGSTGSGSTGSGSTGSGSTGSGSTGSGSTGSTSGSKPSFDCHSTAGKAVAAHLANRTNRMPTRLGPVSGPKAGVGVFASGSELTLRKTLAKGTVVHEIDDRHTTGAKWLKQSKVKFDIHVKASGASSEFRVCSMLINPTKKTARVLGATYVGMGSAKSARLLQVKADLGHYHSRWGSEVQFITYIAVRNRSAGKTLQYAIYVDRSKRETTSSGNTGSSASSGSTSGSARHEIVVKSFIGRVGKKIGRFANHNKAHTVALKGFATASDIGFTEDPKTHVDDQTYRIYAKKVVRAHCIGGKAKFWNKGNEPIVTGSGCEPANCRLPGALKAPNPTTGYDRVRLSGDKLYVDFYVYGEPDWKAHKATTTIRHRTCTNIWYKIKARFSCAAETGRAMKVDYIKMDRSKFPSARLWYNGKVFKGLTGTGVGAGTGTAVQGDIVTLWDCQRPPHQVMVK